ncbi:mob kinase activator-like [Anaeramoeba flamelloides]|uniref:Mob kinase activator-like n=1 Tax=Anaeramoeba flamelloides TaxID=1746091 RepID=A0AAV8A2J9_9EUKA|nr:mob kinase activator-like [Anaeramoeba flamelloides]
MTNHSGLKKRRFFQARTFKKVKRVNITTNRYNLHEYAEGTLGVGNIEQSVKLPEGENINDWLAMNTIEFQNTAKLLFQLIQERCTTETCPKMTAGPRYEYYWKEGKKLVQTTYLLNFFFFYSSNDYMNRLLLWVDELTEDPKIFPPMENDPFPKHFKKYVAVIFKRLFRVYAHIFTCHFRDIQDMGTEPHFNSCYKHFLLFVLHFKLLKKSDLEPLKVLNEKLLKNTKTQKKK